MPVINDEAMCRLGFGALKLKVREAYRTELLRKIGTAIRLRVEDELDYELQERYAELADAPARVVDAWLQINVPGYSRLAACEVTRCIDALADRAEELVSLELSFAAEDASEPHRRRLNTTT